VRKLLIDLDSLLDTRLGVIAALDSHSASHLVTSSRYWERERNDWERLTNGRVTNEQFEEAWKARTGDILPLSTMTGIFLVVINLLMDFQKVVAEGIVDDDIRIEVNIHPYVLSDDEQEAILGALKRLFYKELVITFCDWSLDALTPQELITRYDGAFMYDFVPWMKRHAFALAKCRAPDFCLMVPRLFEKDVDQLTMEEKQNATLVFRAWLHLYMSIDFIEPKWFSMYRPGIDTPAKNDLPD
jgi:hypothetical protein